MFVQAIRGQKRRDMFLLPPESNQAIALRTLTIPNPDVDPDELEKAKVGLLKRVGLKIADGPRQTNGPNRYRQQISSKRPTANSDPRAYGS